MKKFFISCSIAILALFIGGIGYLYSIQEREIFAFPKLEENYQFAWTIPHEEMMIPTSNDGKINALLFHAKGEKAKGAIFYCHGKGSNMSHPKWGDLLERYTGLGFDFFMLDYRGAGKSRGEMIEDQMLNDCNEVYQVVKARYGEENVTVYGKSLGTSFATYVASNNHPRTLILEAPFFNLFDVACSTLPSVPPFMISMVLKYPLKTNEWLANVNCPVYLLHGTSDEIIPHSASMRLKTVVEKNNQPVDLLILEKGDHDHLFKFEAYNEKIEEALGLHQYMVQKEAS